MSVWLMERWWMHWGNTVAMLGVAIAVALIVGISIGIAMEKKR